MQSDELDKSPDLLSNFIHDTTIKLENLTNELKNHDNDDFKIPSKNIEANFIESTETETKDNNATRDLYNYNCGRKINGSSESTNEAGNFICSGSQTNVSNEVLRFSSNYEIKEVPRYFPKHLDTENALNGDDHDTKGITVKKHASLGLNLMQSVELEGTSYCNGQF